MTRKRIIIITAITLTVLLLVAGWYFFIRSRYTGVINAMPDDVVCFFDVNDTKQFGQFIQQEPSMQSLAALDMFGQMYSDYALYTAIMESHPGLQADFRQGRCLAAAFSAGQEKVDYLFLLDLDKAKRLRGRSFLPELNGKQPKVSAHTFEKESIYELRYPELQIAFSFATVNGVFIYSTTPVLVENAILQLKKGDPVSEQSSFSAVQTEMEPAAFTLYLHMPKLAEHLARYSGNTQYQSVMQIGKYADWLGLQIEAKPTGLLLNGFCATTPDGGQILNQYSGAFNADMHPAVPANTAVLYRVLTEQLAERIAPRMQNETLNRAFFDHWSPWMGTQLIVGATESLDRAFLKRAFVIIPAADVKLGQSKIDRITKKDTVAYRDVEVFELEAGELISKLSGYSAPEICYGAWLADALVVTFEKQQLLQMIDAFSNRATLVLQDDYRDFRSEVSASFNNSIYVNLAASEQLLRNLISDKHIDSLSQDFVLLRQFPIMEMQFTAYKDMYMVNGFIRYNSTAERPAGTLWTINVDAPVARGPFTVFNEVTGQRNIIVQDTSNQMYLISAGGDVIWKKQLSSPILSSINEVDFYGNDKTQFLFNTKESIHLIDIHGEPVEGFPITLTTPMSNGVSVFMSAKNDYRFFVACANNNIYGYYKDGKPIAGWNPLRNAGQVQLPMFTLPTVKGQAIGYINAKGIELRNAAGATLLSVPSKYPLAEVVRLDSALYGLDTAGTLVSINKSLAVSWIPSETPVSFASVLPAHLDSVQVIWIMEDGYLKLKNLKGENLFIAEPAGVVNALIAMKGGNVPFFGYTTTDGNMTLLDNTGKPRKGFPLKGSVYSVIDDLTASGDNILITISGSQLIAYRIP